MVNEIILRFDSTITGLAGYQYGKKTFEEQVEGKINYQSEKIILLFPDNIRRMASSFIQGFFEDIVKNIGLEGIGEKMEITSGKNKDNLKEMVINNLL